MCIKGKINSMFTLAVAFGVSALIEIKVFAGGGQISSALPDRGAFRIRKTT